MSVRIGVIGAGVMGSGIAQSLATGGIETVCTDISEEALEKAKEGVTRGRFGFERAVERGKLSQEDAEAAFARLDFTQDFEAAAQCDIVIECVPERLDLKVRLFRDLDAAAPADTVLASNSSGFPIAALAAATDRPSLVMGWHWASPPVLMRFAELVVTDATDAAAIEKVRAAAQQCGKNPIVVKDDPMAWGYVANRIYFAMIQEAQRVVDAGIAKPEEVNQLMVDCYNWPVGPFAMVKGAGDGWS